MEGDKRKPKEGKLLNPDRSRSAEPERGCAVAVTVRFRDEDGEAVAVQGLAASDFTVRNGELGMPSASPDGLSWTVAGWARPAYTGLMRVRLSETERWQRSEQVFRVSGDDACAPVPHGELLRLALDGMTLDPGFSGTVTAYAARAPAETEQATVTATAVYRDAEVAIAPEDADAETEGHQVALATGDNDVTVAVTPAYGGAAKTYTVTVTRDAAATPADADATRAGAVSLGAQSPSRGRQFFTGYSLDRANGDAVDYYTFTTDGRYVLGLGVRDQTVELQVTLEDAAGATVGTAGPPADPNKDQLYIEWLKQVIEPGTYYIRVEAPADGATDYYIRFGLTEALPALSVADARAEEGVDATLDFAVTLDRSPTETVSVDYATADGTATAGQDYTAAAGTLTFAVGETAKTVSVAVLDDARDDGEETMTLTLANAAGATIDDGTATGTIQNADPLPRAWLARFGRVAAGHVLDAVAGRLAGAPASSVSVGGHRLDAEAAAAHAAETLASGESDPLAGVVEQEQATSMTFAELLAGSSFDLTYRGNGGAGRWGVWGRGAWSSFAGSDGDLRRLDGEVLTATAGADYEQGRTLAGLALAYSIGSGSYEHASGDSGELRSTLLSVHPYARLTLHERLAVWGLLGYGLAGDLELAPRGAVRAPATDTGLLMGAFGARGTLLAAGPAGGFELTALADALLLRMSSDAVEGLEGASAEVTRTRVLLQAAWRDAQVLGGVLTPALEIGGRYDGGDAERGAGLVVGGSLDYALPAWGLTLSASGRGLLVHEHDGFREWSAGGALSFDPGAPGRGLALRVTPSWGLASPGAGELWSLPDASSLAATAAPGPVAAQMSAELSYGLEIPAAGILLTPFAGLELTEGATHTTRAGARLGIDPGLTLSLEGSRTAAAGQDAAPASRLVPSGTLRY